MIPTHFARFNSVPDQNNRVAPGRTQEGFEKYREAVAVKSVLRAWEALSMEEQAPRIAELSGVSSEDGLKPAAIYEGENE